MNLSINKVSIDYAFSRYVRTSRRGWIAVACPALPECVSQGSDEKEALENIKEAITAWLWAELYAH